jgi:hypothetical protein
VAITFSVRAGVLAVAALLILCLAGSAAAERPGWYSDPSVSGSADVGAILTASDGGLRCVPGCAPDGPEPSRAGVLFEWVSCSGASSSGSDRPTGGMPDERRPCPGGVSRGAAAANATSYTVRPDDSGRWIQLHVVATNYDCGEWNYSTGTRECNYSTAHGYSATIGPIGGSAAAPPPPPAPSAGPAGAPNMTVYPTTTGLAKEGETIASAPGSWTDSPTTFAYQWKRCAAAFEPCAPISGATGARYVLTADDVGSRVQVLVTASNPRGSNSAASFPTEIVATSAVAPANTALPTITGIAEDRQTLTAAPGTWTGTQPMGYAYQWQRCSTGLGGCAPISGATQSTYVLTREDLAGRLVVSVTASNRAGAGTATSGRTGHVLAAKPRAGSDRLAIEEIDSPNRLVLASVRLGTAKLRPRGRTTVTVRVTDRRGFLIEGASVRVSGPRGVAGGTAATNTTGVATIGLRTGAKLPRSVVLTVSVSKRDEPALTVTKFVRVPVKLG